MGSRGGEEGHREVGEGIQDQAAYLYVCMYGMWSDEIDIETRGYVSRCFLDDEVIGMVIGSQRGETDTRSNLVYNMRRKGSCLGGKDGSAHLVVE